MNSLIEYENLKTQANGDSIAKSASANSSLVPSISTARFVESSFIPNHVALKTQSGRTHYHAMLKHVLRPETVDRLLIPYCGEFKSRMKSIPNWPYLDETKLCDITADHVRHLTSHAVSHGYSPQTVKHIKNVISAIISHAKRERVFSGDNPMIELRLPPIIRKAIPSISLVDAKAIFRTMGYPERQIALIIFNTGMTVSEVCGLQWSYVNSGLRPFYVDRDIVPPRSILVNYQRNSRGLIRLRPDRVRVIEISAPLLDLLTSLEQQRNRPNSEHFLFADERGTPFSPTRILVSRLKPIGRRLGIPFSWHTLKEVHEVFMQDLCSNLNSELATL